MNPRKWLFVLPYYVVVSTGFEGNEDAYLKTHEYESAEPNARTAITMYTCPPELKCAEFLKDLANALNDSRERREQLKYGSTTGTPMDSITIDDFKRKIQAK